MSCAEDLIACNIFTYYVLLKYSDVLNLDVADDFNLLAQRVSDLQDKVDTLKRIVSRIGLCINIGKRKYMRVYDLSRTQLVLNENTVEQGDIMSFVYLGSVVTKEGNTLPD